MESWMPFKLPRNLEIERGQQTISLWNLGFFVAPSPFQQTFIRTCIHVRQHWKTKIVCLGRSTKNMKAFWWCMLLFEAFSQKSAIDILLYWAPRGTPRRRWTNCDPSAMLQPHGQQTSSTKNILEKYHKSQGQTVKPASSYREFSFLASSKWYFHHFSPTISTCPSSIQYTQTRINPTFFQYPRHSAILQSITGWRPSNAATYRIWFAVGIPVGLLQVAVLPKYPKRQFGKCFQIVCGCRTSPTFSQNIAD